MGPELVRGDANAAHEHTLLFQRRFLDFMQQNLTAKMRIS